MVDFEILRQEFKWLHGVGGGGVACKLGVSLVFGVCGVARILSLIPSSRNGLSVICQSCTGHGEYSKDRN